QRRDKEFAKRKAERAVMRSQIRAKYQLGQNDRDTQQLRAVTGKVDVPVELAAVIKVGRGSEGPSSRLGEFRGLPEVNLSELSNSAQSAISQLRESAGRQCALILVPPSASPPVAHNPMKGLSGKVCVVPGIRGALCGVAPGIEGQIRVHSSSPWTASEGQGVRPYEAIPSTGSNSWFNLYRLWKNDGFRNIHQVMTHNFEMLGPIYREKLGRKETVNVFLPEDIAVLFRSEGTLPRRMMLDAWVCHREYRNHKCGIFLKNGEEWRSERLLLNKEVISPAAVRRFAPLLQPVADDFTKFIVRRLEGGREVTEVNMLPDLFRFALESSFHLLYGERLGLFDAGVCPSSERFIQAVEEMLQTTIPLLYLPPGLARRLNLKPWRDHVAAWDYLFQHADQCIKQLCEKVRNIPEGRVQYSGILTELLLKSQLPVDIIKANVTELMVGSVDTTAHSLLFTLFELARNPDIQTALRKEVDAAYREAEGDVWKLLQTVPLLRAAIKETLRLYPIGVTLQRYPVRDIVIQNYHIPAGTLVQAGIYSLGRSAAIFPEPQQYDPGRWLSADTHSFRAVSFGFGVRQCIGRRVAETEIALFLIHVLRRFRIVSRSKADIKLIYGFIVMVDQPPLLALQPIPPEQRAV
ncbi:cytochrome P450 11B, mitochondrial-like, partial [Mustelus asterias]